MNEIMLIVSIVQLIILAIILCFLMTGLAFCNHLFKGKKAVNKYFVSYFYTTEEKYGHGSININAKGIFSIDDIKAVMDEIKTHLKNDLKLDTGAEIEVVVLNWRKFDEP